MTNWNLV